VPIYEFDCSACGARFESLVDAGTATVECAECGADGAGRRFSQFAPPNRQLTPNQRRRLEDKRGIDRGGARRRWGQTMQRARERRKSGGGGGG
jgi:putative FmdB family regulatory protein